LNLKQLRAASFKWQATATAALLAATVFETHRSLPFLAA
jgi:hypothetical protein